MSMTTNFIRIEKVAGDEAARLRKEYGSYKADHIDRAVDRLYCAVVAQQPAFKNNHKRQIHLHKIEENDLASADLSSEESMLDMSIREWDNGTPDYDEQGVRVRGRPEGFRYAVSVREALNISGNNFFNLIGFGDATWGPFWGKCDALLNVERKLLNRRAL